MSDSGDNLKGGGSPSDTSSPAAGHSQPAPTPAVVSDEASRVERLADQFRLCLRALSSLLRTRLVAEPASDRRLDISLEMDPAVLARLKEFLQQEGMLGETRERTTAREESAAPVAARILIVDDDQLTRTLLRRILEEVPGREFHEAANGREAWEMLESDLRPHLCLLDLQMPAMGGLLLLQRMRADDRFKGMPVIVCSVVNQPDTILKAGALRADYLLKPFVRSVLLEKVDKALSQETAGALAKIQAAQKRLALERNEYMELLGRLSVEMVSVAQGAGKDLLMGNSAAASKAVLRLRDLASSVGEDETVSQLMSIELAISRSELDQSLKMLERLGSDAKRIDQLAKQVWRNYSDEARG